MLLECLLYCMFDRVRVAVAYLRKGIFGQLDLYECLSLIRHIVAGPS